MTSAQLQNTAARRPTGFSLERYVKKEKFFAYPLNGSRIQLEVLFEKDAVFHLSERPLAKDQRLIPQRDGRVLLQATVRDTLELRWWLLGFGDKVEVVSPNTLREEFKVIAQRMNASYQR
jgi:predicted DNA-binding transcriptional regulator YafY